MNMHFSLGQVHIEIVDILTSSVVADRKSAYLVIFTTASPFHLVNSAVAYWTLFSQIITYVDRTQACSEPTMLMWSSYSVMHPGGDRPPTDQRLFRLNPKVTYCDL